MEITQHLLDRIAAEDAALNSFILVTPERALADARAVEARVMNGASLGTLDGIPIAHKDIYGTAGIPTTAHSKLLEGWIPDTDATTVRKLKDAGRVMLGKLATHEFAFGGPSFDLPWPPARNPWNTDHFTAGSSSCTGATVAAGLILGGTGSDTGGSIRGPAALCGIGDYGELLRDRMAFGGLIAATDYVQALRMRRELCAAMTAAAQGVDLLITAGAPAEAPRIDAVPKWDNLARPGFTAPFDLTGWPAMSVCSGFGVDGLPVSVQIAAKPFQEATLLRAAHAFEQATSFRAKRPVVTPASIKLVGAAA